MDDFSFDATQHEPAQDISEPIPADWYLAEVSGTQIKKTKAGTGTILEIEYTVSGGDYKGRKVWTGFNVRNPNETAEKIAREQLSALCHATGVLKFRTHEQLRGKRCLIRVVIKTQDGYEPRNEVKAWKDGGAVRPMSHTAPVTTSAPARGSDEAWQKPDDDGLPF